MDLNLEALAAAYAPGGKMTWYAQSSVLADINSLIAKVRRLRGPKVAEAVRTVRVRIAVCVNRDGHWGSGGWWNGSDESKESVAFDTLDRRLFI